MQSIPHIRPVLQDIHSDVAEDKHIGSDILMGSFVA